MPIYEEMVEWLTIQKEIRDQNISRLPVGVFHRGGRPIKDFCKNWEKAIGDAGIRRFIPHDLRRTAARQISRAGIPERIVMNVCGWKTRSMLDRYNSVAQSDLDVFRGRMEARAAERKAAQAAEDPKSCSTIFSSIEGRRLN